MSILLKSVLADSMNSSFVRYSFSLSISTRRGLIIKSISKAITSISICPADIYPYPLESSYSKISPSFAITFSSKSLEELGCGFT